MIRVILLQDGKTFMVISATGERSYHWRNYVKQSHFDTTENALVYSLHCEATGHTIPLGFDWEFYCKDVNTGSVSDLDYLYLDSSILNAPASIYTVVTETEGGEMTINFSGINSRLFGKNELLAIKTNEIESNTICILDTVENTIIAICDTPSISINSTDLFCSPIAFTEAFNALYSPAFKTKKYTELSAENNVPSVLPEDFGRSILNAGTFHYSATNYVIDDLGNKVTFTYMPTDENYYDDNSFILFYESTDNIDKEQRGNLIGLNAKVEEEKNTNDLQGQKITALESQVATLFTLIEAIPAVEQLLQEEISSNTTLNAGHFGKTLRVTAPVTITVPASLPENFRCDGIVKVGGLITWNIETPSAWLYGTPQQTGERRTFTLLKDGNSSDFFLLQ